MTNVYNPFSTLVPSSKTYTVETYTSAGYEIDVGSATGPTLSLSPNSLTTSLIDPTTPIVVGALETYEITIKNPNNKVPGTSGTYSGYLQIVLPSEVTLDSTSCSA